MEDISLVILLSIRQNLFKIFWNTFHVKLDCALRGIIALGFLYTIIHEQSAGFIDDWQKEIHICTFAYISFRPRRTDVKKLNQKIILHRDRDLHTHVLIVLPMAFYVENFKAHRPSSPCWFYLFHKISKCVFTILLIITKAKVR